MTSIYNRGHDVGKQHHTQVFLDPTTVCWIIANTAGNELRKHAAEQLTAERIQTLEVTFHRNRKPKLRTLAA